MLKDEGTTRSASDIMGTAGGTPPKRESLASMAKRWKAATRSGACAPLVVAREVVDVIDHWDRYGAEADGMLCNDWLRIATSKAEQFWRGRARGLDLLGESARRTVNHDVANYVGRNVPAEFVAEVRDMLISECKANNGHPLEYGPARCRIVEITGTTRPRTKVCTRCQNLEALLREHGIDVPE